MSGSELYHLHQDSIFADRVVRTSDSHLSIDLDLDWAGSAILIDHRDTASKPVDLSEALDDRVGDPGSNSACIDTDNVVVAINVDRSLDKDFDGGKDVQLIFILILFERVGRRIGQVRKRIVWVAAHHVHGLIV